MACEAMTLTPAQKAERLAKLKDLERQIEQGKVRVQVLGEHAEFIGWDTDRTGPGHWHDDCAFRTLSAQGSSALRMALAREEVTDDRMTREQLR